MKSNRLIPDELNISLYMEEGDAKKGKLKIFFGISPGVGKTQAMLQAAHAEVDKGIDVVVGWVERHMHPGNYIFLEGLKVIPPKKMSYDGTYFEEPDLDTLLEIHPQLVLIANLAHTNAPGSRNMKRYQDLWELMDNGIDVYTTVNMIYLESCINPVAQITGFYAAQTLPDEVFEQADEVELVDVTPNKLLARLAEGVVNLAGYPKEAANNFFRIEKIAALRKILFRVMTDRLNYRYHTRQVRKTKSHILVWIDTDPIIIETIQRTETVAGLMDANWTALYVETGKVLTDRERIQLANNIKLVRQRGGDLVTFSGNDPVKACMEVARRENVTHIIVGKPQQEGIFNCAKQRLVNRLLKESGKINVYVVGAVIPNRKCTLPEFASGMSKYTATILAYVVTALLGVSLADKTGYQFLPFAVLLVLLVMVAILRVGIKWLAAALTILALGIFLIPPQFTFMFNLPADIPLFLTFFSVALFCGVLAIRFRKQLVEMVNREKQTNALFLLTKRLNDAIDTKGVVETGIENIQKYFFVDAFFIFSDNQSRLTNQKYIPHGIELSEQELDVANQAFKLDKITGRFTDTLPACRYTYHPMNGASLRVGVAVVKQKEPFTGKTAVFWDAFLTQIAQAVEHRHLEQLVHKTSLLDESDKLYKTLFNSISHELRIPVATIMGASDVLLMTDNDPEPVRKELYNEILNASQRLNRLIENLLNISRLESGRIAIRPDWFDVSDLFNRVKENLEEELRPFHVKTIIPESMPLVRLDFGLMEQTIYNLVYNSSLYATPGTDIRLRALYVNGCLVIQVMDRGSRGFNPNDLPHVFDKFWRPQNSTPGGLGLGLPIVKGFVEAHKGTVKVENRKNGGVRFTITIPTKISNEYEK